MFKDLESKIASQTDTQTAAFELFSGIGRAIVEHGDYVPPHLAKSGASLAATVTSAGAGSPTKTELAAALARLSTDVAHHSARLAELIPQLQAAANAVATAPPTMTTDAQAAVQAATATALTAIAAQVAANVGNPTGMAALGNQLQLTAADRAAALAATPVPASTTATSTPSAMPAATTTPAAA